MVGTMHTREEHRGLHHILLLGAYHEILVLFIGLCLLLGHVYLGTLFHYGNQILTLYLTCHLRGVGAAIEEGRVAILLAVEVATESEDILG